MSSPSPSEGRRGRGQTATLQDDDPLGVFGPTRSRSRRRRRSRSEDSVRGRRTEIVIRQQERIRLLERQLHDKEIVEEVHMIELARGMGWSLGSHAERNGSPYGIDWLEIVRAFWDGLWRGFGMASREKRGWDLETQWVPFLGY